MCRPLYLLHIYLTLVESAGTAHTDGSNTCSNQQYGTTVSSQTVLLLLDYSSTTPWLLVPSSKLLVSSSEIYPFPISIPQYYD